jgi:hypothetical protein
MQKLRIWATKKPKIKIRTHARLTKFYILCNDRVVFRPNIEKCVLIWVNRNASKFYHVEIADKLNIRFHIYNIGNQIDIKFLMSPAVVCRPGAFLQPLLGGWALITGQQSNCLVHNWKFLSCCGLMFATISGAWYFRPRLCLTET